MKNLLITLFFILIAIFVFLHPTQEYAITGCTGTCIYSTAGHCDCGTGDSGFNPPSCSYSYGSVSCPAVQSITAHVQTTTGAPVPGVPVHFNDNGRGGTITTDANGNASSQVWEDDSMQITPGLAGSITGFSPAGMSFTFDGAGSCSGNICTFIAAIAPPPPPPVTAPPPVGNHDAADCSQGIWGWTCQQGYYSSANRVDVYIDGPYGTGTILGSINADVSRPDLITANVCGGTGNHGFVLDASKMPHDGKTHSYYAYAINLSGNNQNPLLSNTPKSATCAQDPISLTLVLGLPGIGYNGPTGVSPKHLTRSVTVQLYDASVTDPSGPGTAPLATGKGTVTFDSGSDSNAGYFVGTISNISLPTTPPANNQYKILVQVPQYLYQLAVVTPPPSDSSQANIFTLTSGQSVTTAPFSLLPGDVYTANGGLNHLNLDDYNQILTCFNSASDPTCTKTADGLLFADLDDNGVVDIVDMNLWLRSLSQLTQAQAPGCSTGDCQGD